MLSHPHAVGDSHQSRLSIRRWAVWAIPVPARMFLLLVELGAAAATVTLLATEQLTHTTLIRFAVLSALSIGYAEFAARSERLTRYLGSDRVFANPMSVWSFAALLTLPAGWAAALIALQYGHAMLQRRRDRSGRPYRVAFTAGAAMLAQLAAAAVLDNGVAATVLHGQALATAAVLAAVLAFTAVNLAIVLVGVRLTARPPSIRMMFPDQEALCYEFATLVLGIAAAEFLLHAAALVPVLLVLVAYLHRGSVVKALHQAARTDTKTGLLNTTAWTEHASRVLAKSTRAGRGVAVLVVDIDHFKTINDLQGHLVGDQVLLAVTACLRSELRRQDCLGRFGGDEFVVILDEIDLARAQGLGNRLRSAISGLDIVGDTSISVSIGLTHVSSSSQLSDIHELLGRADAALYRAKSAGRNRLCTAGTAAA
ncbi:MAG: diguanylate cyclase [Jatrophihabitantaceae bacterium]